MAQEIPDNTTPENEIRALVGNFTKAVGYLLLPPQELGIRGFERRQRYIGVALETSLIDGRKRAVARTPGFFQTGKLGIVGGAVISQTIVPDKNGRLIYSGLLVVTHGSPRGGAEESPQVNIELPTNSLTGKLTDLEDVLTFHGEPKMVVEAVRMATEGIDVPEQGFVLAYPGPGIIE